MDLSQLENIIAIAEEKNIARAAERKFLTQSALNQQLLRLEKELGTPLFERKYHSLELTPAGNAYIMTAREMLKMKEDTYKIIQDIARNDAGEISIAFTPEKGAIFFADVYIAFREKYPKFTFRTYEARVPRIMQLLLKKFQLDLIFFIGDRLVERNILEQRHMFQRECVLKDRDRERVILQSGVNTQIQVA